MDVDLEWVVAPSWAVRNRAAIVSEFPDLVSVDVDASRGRSTLTLHRRMLVATLDGTSLDLNPSEYLALETLVMNRDRVVSRQHLLTVISDHDGVRSDGRLREIIHRVRRALGDAGGSICTVHRRGYRWIVSPADG